MGQPGKEMDLHAVGRRDLHVMLIHSDVWGGSSSKGPSHPPCCSLHWAPLASAGTLLRGFAFHSICVVLCVFIRCGLLVYTPMIFGGGATAVEVRCPGLIELCCRFACHPITCVDYWTKELEALLMLCSCTSLTCNVVHDVHVQCCACLYIYIYICISGRAPAPNLLAGTWTSPRLRRTARLGKRSRSHTHTR